MIDHGMSLINDTLHIHIPDAPEVNKVIYNGVEFVSGAQWIPCSEMLPDLDKYVLCTVNDQGEGNEVAMMCLTTSIKTDDYYWTDYACEYSWELCEVFAWMPLPNPYKEEEDGCVHQ